MTLLSKTCSSPLFQRRFRSLVAKPSEGFLNLPVTLIGFMHPLLVAFIRLLEFVQIGHDSLLPGDLVCQPCHVV